MVINCACFEPMLTPYSYYKCRTSDIAAVGSPFNVFSHDMVSVENQTHQLPDDVLWYGRGEADIFLSVRLSLSNAYVFTCFIVYLFLSF